MQSTTRLNTSTSDLTYGCPFAIHIYYITYNVAYTDTIYCYIY